MSDTRAQTIKSRVATYYGRGILAFSVLIASITALGLIVMHFNGG